MERSQPTSAPIVSFINHEMTDSDTWRLFISLLHTGATTTNSAVAAGSIWERLISGPSRADRAGRQGRKGDTSFTFTSTGNLTDAKGAETADEEPADAWERRKADSIASLLQPLPGH